MPLLFWVLDTACTSAYLIISELDRGWCNQHKTFVRELAWSLVVEGTSGEREVARRSQGGASSVPLNIVRAAGCAEARGYFCSRNAREGLDLVVHNPHYPLRVESNGRRDCFNCRLKVKDGGAEQQRRKTPFKCGACGLFLCIDERRNCFKELREEYITS